MLEPEGERYIRELKVRDGTLFADGQEFACVLGRDGVTADKREGDHKTPKGSFAMRACYFRPDRVIMPGTGLPSIALIPEDGWCDDANHPDYNRPVKLPFAGSHEKLWREDGCYDLIVPLGYNDDPVVPGKGSAIFLHCMHDGAQATEGCIAMKKEDLLGLLPRFSTATIVTI